MTDLMESKLERGFSLILDTSGDGCMDKTDFTGLAQRLAGTFPGTPDAKRNRLESTLKALWDNHLSALDSDGDNAVSKAEFIVGWTKSLTSSRDKMVADFSNASVAWMDIADKDDNGSVDKEEFVHMYSTVLGLANEALAESFDKLDRDSDGALSLSEIQQAVTEYWISDDPEAPGNWLFGPVA